MYTHMCACIEKYIDIHTHTHTHTSKGSRGKYAGLKIKQNTNIPV